jgi:hypothetical protein
VAATLPEQAEAKFVAAGGAGAVVMIPGGTVSGSLPSSTCYGLVATTDPSLTLSSFAQNTRIGVFGLAASIFGGVTNYGVFGQGGEYGVKGKANTYGVYGESSGYGVYGSGPIGIYGIGPTGVFGSSSTPNGEAGHFDGNVNINGQMNGQAKFFKIDHPLDPSNKYLNHASIESPDMLNLYSGIVTLDQQGQATIELPSWFEALNSDYRYQLTALETASPNLHISQLIINNKFKLAGGQPGQQISWMVTGIRQDAWAKAHPIKVEEDKSEKEKGFYLHPELFGQPKEKSVSSLITKAGKVG